MENLTEFDNQIYYKNLGFGPMPPNISSNWWLTDSEKLFDNNWQNSDSRTKLQILGWDKNSIKYVSNDAGFRMDINMKDIKPGTCDIYLGDSHTFGTGLNLEDVWCWNMAKSKGLPCVNFGSNGASIETQYRLLRCWAERLRPKKVYTLGAFIGRREILSEKTNHNLGRWSKMDNNPYKSIYEVLSKDNELIISTIRAADAIKFICINYNIELFTIRKKERNRLLSPIGYDRLARDLIHNSPDWHSNIANLPETAWERIA
jgi:hypothetical protein